MNELKWTLFGFVGLAVSLVILWYTHMPLALEDKDMDILIALGIGLLILLVDKKSDRHLHEIIQTQHKMTLDMREIMEEQLRILKELQSAE